jgi:hypothetical protein
MLTYEASNVGAAMKRGPAAAEKKAVTLIWIGTAIFLIGIFCLHHL